MRKVKDVQPPAGLTRLLLRIPVYAYRLGLGWVFGDRLLMLNHTGRVSGRQYQTILEVVEHDPDDSYVAASGWGPTAAWYRNIEHNPHVSIRVGRRRVRVKAVPLEEDAGADIFARYASRHRTVARYVLPRMLGMAVDGTEADFREVGRRMPFVRFVPLTSSDP